MDNFLAAATAGCDYWISPAPASCEPVRVTVVVPAFDSEATLARAIQSILSQTLRDIEIIVVDDASTDDSWAIVAALLKEDDRVRCIRNPQNFGKPIGVNRATAHARGRWLAILDADDWYHPGRLAALIALGEREKADLVADNQFFFDAHADAIVGTAWRSGQGDWPLSFDGFLKGSNAYATFNLGMLKPILRLDFIRRAALSYEEKARHGQDFFHMLQFFLAGGVAAISDSPYYYYTQPFGRISHSWSHPARKRYDFLTAFDINRRYLARARDGMTRWQAGRLAKRNRHLELLEYYYQTKECVGAGNFAGAISRVIRHPGMTGYAAWRLRCRVDQHAEARIIERVAAAARKRMDREATNAMGPSS
jgi:succinoglycan biosynthesis protein ExoO